VPQGLRDGDLASITDELRRVWGAVVGGHSDSARVTIDDPYYTNGSQVRVRVRVCTFCVSVVDSFFWRESGFVTRKRKRPRKGRFGAVVVAAWSRSFYTHTHTHTTFLTGCCEPEVKYCVDLVNATRARSLMSGLTTRRP
jgi:hypothetical protein